MNDNDDTQQLIELGGGGGELRARVYRHAIPVQGHAAVRCLTYVSDGLAAHGQKEVVWTVRDYGGTPPEPLRWFEMLLGYARAGRVVDAFGVTEFRADGWFGRGDMAAVVYMPAQVVAGVPEPLPESRLHAVPLTAAERPAGLLRVLAMLGYAARYFPFPPWFDCRRPSVLSDEQLAESLLTKAGGGVGIPGVSATRRVTVSQPAPEVVLRIRPGATEAVRAAVEAHPPDSVLALRMLELHEDADACMVWTPGSPSLQAIGSGSTMNALGMCFVLFCPQQTHFELRQVEDGYTVLITDELWERVRHALITRQSLFLPADPGTGPNGTSLRVEWVHETLPSATATHEQEVTLNLSDFPQQPGAHVYLESITLQELDTPPTAGHVLSILAFARAALAALLATIPTTPPTVKPSADVPRDVSYRDDDTDPEYEPEADEERWVLATLEFADGGGALSAANVVCSPGDGAGLDVGPLLKKTLRAVEMPRGTPRCKFQMVLRLWRPDAVAV